MNLFRRFGSARSGNVAAMFALAVLPLITVVGAAVDYSGAGVLYSQLQADTDATALMACKSTLTAQSDLKSAAQTALNGYMPNYTVTIDKFVATNNPRSIDLVARVTYPTKFMKIANIRSMSISAESSCSAGEQFFEIALVLDTTGSMNNAATSGRNAQTKIQALRTAATNFVNTMFSSVDSAHLKMSIVPFAAMVKVDPSVYGPTGSAPATWLDTNGTSSVHWQNLKNVSSAGFTIASRFDVFTKLKAARSSWGWAGCLESLPYPQNTRDDAPSTSADTLYVPSFAPDENGTEVTTTRNGRSSTDWDMDSYNNHMDDGSADGGSCDNHGGDSSSSTRLGQACKYKSPKNIDTSKDGPNSQCTSNAITLLTNTKATLTTAISNLTASGSTNIHQGLHWGWRTISPNGVFSGPAAYGTANVTKVIVVMTDGMNQWLTGNDVSNEDPIARSYYSAYGFLKNADGTNANGRLPTGNANPTTGDQTRAAIDQLTRETCTNARNKNVQIYTVAFSVSGDAIDSSGQTLLSDCTGNNADRTFVATDADSLNDTFAAIAQGIGQLRIVK